jgi:hypothetical protein
VARRQAVGDATPTEVDIAREREKRAADAAAAAQEKREAAEAELTKKQKEQQDAKTAAEAVKKKAEELNEKAGQDLPPEGMEGEGSPACRRLAANGHDINDPVDMQRLPEDWVAMMERIDPRTIYPNPDAGELHPSDAFALPACGLDPATTNGSAVICDRLVFCTEEMEQCGCTGVASAGEAMIQRFLRDQAVHACAATTCPDGSQPVATGGIICACQSTEAGEVPLLPPRPLPNGVVEAIFLAPEVQTPIDGNEDPLSLFAREALRR